MKSSSVKISLGLALVVAVAPLFAAEKATGNTPTRPDVTLLTGPNLLSPATRPINSPSISSEIVTPGRTTREMELEAVLKKRAATQDRLDRLRAQRATALERKRELEAAASGVPPQPATTPRAETIRFETQLPPTPLALPRSTPPAPPPLKRD